MAFLVIILIVVALCFGILTGRAYEIGKRITERNEELAKREGYGRGRMRIPEYASLQEVELALWRQEGLLGALRDNYYDLNRSVGRYGIEKPDTSKRTEAN